MVIAECTIGRYPYPQATHEEISELIHKDPDANNEYITKKGFDASLISKKLKQLITTGVSISYSLLCYLMNLITSNGTIYMLYILKPAPHLTFATPSFGEKLPDFVKVCLEKNIGKRTNLKGLLVNKKLSFTFTHF
jgi:hypothetical protein